MSASSDQTARLFLKPQHHGSTCGYALGCRCAACRAAKRDAAASYYRRRQTLVDLLAAMDDWLGNEDGLMIEDVIGWRDQLASALGQGPRG